MTYVETYYTDSYRDLIGPPSLRPNLLTGEGHGHFRPLDRHRQEKNKIKKLRKRTKIKKESKRRNRK